ncbi:oligosaccharide flippase family protein [Candidatus Uabimicrobium amorphum]|uniref:Uncharacterized protein n=1 Tax=Uabimicrobium amorphum TaxID=2596890 RepID=A0A5S9ILZ6_UABAM|nr:polysaccharide biosynthesis C-terminal domain-containing protein [Candidatus Uabimicrobium amorphum]BBM84174.1 hypothetical protein UABAM_02530 [Candidatus Uabimicrobium amorphum]
MQKDIKKIGVGAFISLLGIFLRGFAKFAIVPLQIYCLGAKDFGIFITIFSIFTICIIIQRAGLHGMVKFAVENKNCPETLHAILTVSIYVPVLLGFIISFISYILCEFLLANSSSPTTNETIYLLILILPVIGAAEIPLLLTLSFETNLYLLIGREILSPLIEISSLVICLYLFPHLGVIGVIISYALGQFTMYLTGTLFFSRIAKIKNTTFQKRLQLLCQHQFSIFYWIKYCIPLAFSSILLKITQLSDLIILGFFVAPPVVTFYKTMLLICSFIQTVGSATFTVFAPMVSRYFMNEDMHTMYKLYINSTQLNMILAFPAIIATYTTSELLLSAMSFSHFSTTSLHILLIGQFIFLTTAGNGHILSMTNKSHLHFYNGLLGVVLNIVLCFLLIPSFKVIGASLTSVILIAFFSTLRTLQVAHFFKFSFFSYPITTQFFIATLNYFGLVYLSHLLPASGLLKIFEIFLLSYLIYSILYTIIFFDNVKTFINFLRKKYE